jgi:hypothetical protein
LTRIDLQKLQGWTVTSRMKFPGRVSCECPHCYVTSNFPLTGFKDDLSIAVQSSCPSCSELVHFFLVFARITESARATPVEIFVWPQYKQRFTSSFSRTDVPEPLYRAISAANDSFNSGNHTAAAVTGRRALEGVFKYLVQPEKRNLNLQRLIEEVKTKTDLSAPLTQLSHAIRQGGNLGAHFDFEKEPDEDMARTIVELLDYLVSYLYVLPRRIEKLETKLQSAVAPETPSEL